MIQTRKLWVGVGGWLHPDDTYGIMDNLNQVAYQPEFGAI